MKKGTKIKLLPENIKNEDFLEKIEKLSLDVLTVDCYDKVDEEHGVEYFDVWTDELPDYHILCTEYEVIVE